MLIIGAKGLAKEVLEIFHQRNELKDIFFYDDISKDVSEKLFDVFTILKNMGMVQELFKTDTRCIIAVGDPKIRFNLYQKFKAAGANFLEAISPFSTIGHYDNFIGEGTIIMAGTVITNNVKMGVSCLINPNCTISHDTVMGDFVELSPGVQITGNCCIGDFCKIGTNATILPRVVLGSNVTVGAGAVVTKNVGNGLTVVGVPAKVLKK